MSRKRRLQEGVCRLITLASALLLIHFPISAAADAPWPTAFFFHCSGSTAESCISYEVYETKGGHLARIELFGRYILLFPMTDEDLTALNQLIEDDLLLWDGFDGQEDSAAMALDGERFSLRVRYADGTALSAQGTNLFPAGYVEGRSAIVQLFDGLMRAWDIELEEIPDASVRGEAPLE